MKRTINDYVKYLELKKMLIEKKMTLIFIFINLLVELQLEE